MKLLQFLAFTAYGLASTARASNTPCVDPDYTSPLGVQILNPEDSFKPTGPWSLMSKVDSALYIAGMRGVSPTNDSLVDIGYPRVKQAFENMQSLANLARTDLVSLLRFLRSKSKNKLMGSDLKRSCVRLVVYVADMYRWRPVVNQVQQEMWGALNLTNGTSVQYPPRTIVEVQRLNDDDIVEVEGTFWLGQ